MERHWTIDGVDVPLTPQEEIDLDANWAMYDAGIPMRDWKESMQETDHGMPRYLEDLITANSDFTIPENMKTRYDEKVALRATKP